jgi:hypothetical protein
MYENYLKRKWKWVDENPRTAAWIGWVKGLITGFLISLILFSCTAEKRYKKHIKERGPIPQPKFNVELSVLDSVSEILHWEIINDTLHIYTQKDSIRDEYERWEYIRSLDPEGWEE